MSDKPLETQAERVFRERIEALEARVASLEGAAGLYASEREMSGPYADPKVKFPLRGWSGPSFVGQTFSQCSPEFLDAMAESCAWKAANPKPGKEQYAKNDAADARRARTWAKRIREGWRPVAPSAAGDFPGDAPPAAASFDAPDFDAPSFAAPSAFDDSDIPF